MTKLMLLEKTIQGKVESVRRPIQQMATRINSSVLRFEQEIRGKK